MKFGVAPSSRRLRAQRPTFFATTALRGAMYDSIDTQLFDDMANKVSALHRPSAYSEPTAKVETVETHMAWVFLTDHRAYKLKKPIRTDFFDHTTPRARRRACRTELQLNRRLAPEVYRAVTPVVERQGTYEVNAKGRVADWLVEMKRLPRRRTLERYIERDATTPAHVEALGVRLSTFYERTDSAEFEGAEYRRRIQRDIDSKCSSLSAPRYELDPADIGEASRRLDDWLVDHGDLLEARADRVVDAHGDLRPEHVFLLDRGPVVIDCLEFERSLRLLDPVSELSFLSLECDRLGASWIGNRLLGTYSVQTGDDSPAELIPFYKSYHALVRATVAIWHIDDVMLDESSRWRRKATDYLREIPQLL